MSKEPTKPVHIRVETDELSEWTLDPKVFGRFAEHIGGAIYPGVFADYIRNGSFDVWNGSGDGARGAFHDGEPRDYVAYPWEPVGDAEDTHLEQRVGGVRGRRDDDALLNGVEIPDGHALDPPGVPEPRYQRVTLEGAEMGGVRQRVALPDRREPSYDVRVSVRGSLDNCVISLKSPDGTPQAQETVPVQAEWDHHEVQLSLEHESTSRHEDSQYGEYDLTIAGEGPGSVDLDWVMLVPDDAIEGKYNPETVRRLREYNVTSLRWPGGNYASQYRWRNGVGPVADRPVTPVVNWGGLDPNYLGTNEWLRFCELVDAEPYLTVPVWSPAGPEEAADWVEYCNGSTDTEMGALRAEHGHPEPWDVTWWGVGNEVWGSWQVGRSDAEHYAEQYREYHDAMHAVDPGIEIDACGLDPWFTLVHDGSRDGVRLPAQGGDPPVWNEQLFAGAGDLIEGLDIHRYTEGISSHTSEDGARTAWLEVTGETPLGYVEVLVNDPGAWDELFEAVRSVAADHGVDDLRLTVGEWGLRSNEIDAGWPEADTGTLAHAVFAVRALQAFVRNGRDVELAHWTDFSLYAQPQVRGGSAEHPAAHIYRDVAEPILQSEREWHKVDTAVVGAPTRERPATGVSIPNGSSVELVDAVTVGTDSADGVDGTDGPAPRLETILVNGSLTRPVDLAVDYGGTAGVTTVKLFTGVGDDDPFADGTDRDGETAGQDDGYKVETSETSEGAAPIELTMPPGSVGLLSRKPSD